MSEMTQVLGTVAMEPKGEYSADAYYEKLNTVLYNDSTYMAKQPSHNILPTDIDYWQLIGGGVRKEEIVQVFNTIADMKLADLKDGMSVQTLGYYEVNDGGGATYKITNTESQTEYQEELNNDLYATLIVENDIVNIKQFGAKGDNTTDDSTAFQSALNYYKRIVLEKNKTYYVNRVLTIFKDTVLDLNNATIRGGQTHLFVNFKSVEFGWDTTDNYVAYNGNGNISIINGTLTGGDISFIHGENIKLENLNLIDTNNDHYLEICACKNYLVLNCNFQGMKEQLEDRRYVEYIQIDKCNYTSFPWLQENSDTYDDTVNNNITIENCTFKKGITPYDHLYVAIGTHAVTEEPHQNINIINNNIEGPEYRGIRLQKMNNIVIKNNEINNFTAVPIDFNFACTNVKILNNILQSGDETRNITGILFNGSSSQEWQHDNIQILDNKIYSQESVKAINPSSCNNVIISHNLSNAKHICVVENTTNVVFCKNGNFNPDLLNSNVIYTTGTNNTIKYSDVRISINDTLTAQGTTKIATLKYDYTDFNTLILAFGGVAEATYQEIEVTGFEYRKFQLGESYIFSILNIDGTQSVYKLKLDENNAKALTIELLSGNGLTIRSIYGKCF